MNRIRLNCKHGFATFLSVAAIILAVAVIGAGDPLGEGIKRILGQAVLVVILAGIALVGFEWRQKIIEQKRSLPPPAWPLAFMRAAARCWLNIKSNSIKIGVASLDRVRLAILAQILLPRFCNARLTLDA